MVRVERGIRERLSIMRCRRQIASPFFVGVFLSVAWACVAGCGPRLPAGSVEEALPDLVDYNFHVKPILADRCYPCHGPDDNARTTELRLDTETGAFVRLSASKRKYAFVSGSVGRSEVAHRLVSDKPAYRMPPPESNLSVTSDEVALIFKWIEQGAQYKPQPNTPNLSLIHISEPTRPY